MNQRVALAAIGIVPACLTAVLGYLQGTKSSDTVFAQSELSAKKIVLSRKPNPNFQELTYANYGVSLAVPTGWTVEDGPARLAGGEFNLIHRYEADKSAIGMNFRLRPVQPNYINDMASQVTNQRDAYIAVAKDVSVSDVSISGQAGKMFRFVQASGRRSMQVRVYWLRLVPTVQLVVLCAQYTDAADRDEFWRDVDYVVSSMVIATDSWQRRYAKNGG
jgi:hypothetical protein